MMKTSLAFIFLAVLAQQVSCVNEVTCVQSLASVKTTLNGGTDLSKRTTVQEMAKSCLGINSTTLFHLIMTHIDADSGCAVNTMSAIYTFGSGANTNVIDLNRFSAEIIVKCHLVAAEPTATPVVEPTATPVVEPTTTPVVEPTPTSVVEPTTTPTPQSSPLQTCPPFIKEFHVGIQGSNTAEKNRAYFIELLKNCKGLNFHKASMMIQQNYEGVNINCRSQLANTIWGLRNSDYSDTVNLDHRIKNIIIPNCSLAPAEPTAQPTQEPTAQPSTGTTPTNAGLIPMTCPLLIAGLNTGLKAANTAESNRTYYKALLQLCKGNNFHASMRLLNGNLPNATPSCKQSVASLIWSMRNSNYDNNDTLDHHINNLIIKKCNP